MLAQNLNPQISAQAGIQFQTSGLCVTGHPPARVPTDNQASFAKIYPPSPHPALYFSNPYTSKAAIGPTGCSCGEG